MKIKIEDGKTILGLLIHFGHIFSGYKEEDIAQFARGLVMGITLTFDCIIEKDSSDLLPDGPIPPEYVDFALQNIFRAFYFCQTIDRKSLKFQINELNKADLSEVKEMAEKEMIDFAEPSKAFFINPKVTRKQ